MPKFSVSDNTIYDAFVINIDITLFFLAYFV